MTQKVLKVFSCLSFATYPDMYWVEDTSVVCFKGPHMLLVLIAGIPALVGICIGFPVLLLMKLHSSKQQLLERKIVVHYGHFYKGYQELCPYWEVVIYIRKAMLSATVVFAHLLEVEVQGSIALTVLIISIILQTQFLPFKEPKLNNMEVASITTSSFTFLIGNMVHSAQGRYRTSLSILLAIVVLGFVLYMGCELAVACRRTGQKWMEDKGVTLSNLPSLLEMNVQIAKERCQATVKSWSDALGSGLQSVRNWSDNVSSKAPATTQQRGDDV